MPTLAFSACCPRVYKVAGDCNLFYEFTGQPLVRDNSYFYLIHAKQICRIPINAQEGTLAVETPPYPIGVGLPDFPYLVCHQGRIYWVQYGSGTNVTFIKSALVDGSDRRDELSFDGVDSRKNIIQFVVCNYNDSALTSHPAIFYLTDEGKLFRHDVGGALGNATQMGFGIEYFKIQRMADNSDMIFTIKQAEIGRATFALIWRIDPTSGSGTPIYASAITSSISTLETDSKNIYWIEVVTGTGTSAMIKRKALTAAPIATPDVLLDWGYLGQKNLRSDGNYLYYIQNATHGQAINRLSTTAAALSVDMAATYVEAVQTVQRLMPQPDVQLVAGKPTFVRAYAKLLQSDYTTYQRSRPGGRLHGYNASTNAELTGSPLSPLNDPEVSADSDAPNTRGDVNRSFLFRLPAAWAANAGQVRLSFEVNPLGIVPEPTALRANNKVEAVFTFNQKGVPCLRVIPVRVEGVPEYSMNQLLRWNDILERAKSLLPIRDFYAFPDPDDVAEYEFPWSYNGYEIPGDESYVQISLWYRDQTSDDPDHCERTHYLGLVAPQVNGFNGIGLVGGDSLTVRMANGYNSYLPNDPYGGRTLAHELGHNYGMGHVMCGDGDPDQPGHWDYPFDYCRIGFLNWADHWGFDPISQTVISPFSDTGDLMSYRTQRWTSSYTWNYLMGATPNSRSVAIRLDNFGFSDEEIKIIGGARHLLIWGDLNTKTGEVRPGQYVIFPHGEAPLTKVLRSLAAARKDSKETNPYHVLQVDSGGTTLADNPLVTFPVMDDSSDYVVGFAQYLTFDEQTARVQILENTTILHDRPATNNPPVLTLGLVNISGSSLNLNWNTTDADGDPLLYTVQYSSDGGGAYATLTSNYPLTTYHTNLNDLRGAIQGRLRVIATDGLLTDVEDTPDFIVPRHSPTVSIGGVRSGDRIAYGTPLNLSAHVYDLEDGYIPDDQMTWTVRRYMAFHTGGTGRDMNLSEAEPGAYQAILEARDSDSNVSNAVVNFTIAPICIPDAATLPVLDGMGGDEAYSSGAHVRIPISQGMDAQVSLVHTGNKLCILFNGLKLSPADTAGSFAGIRVDKNASGDTFAQSDDYGFFVDERGRVFMQGGDGMGGMPALSNPLEGFNAIVYQSDQSWSAELQIDDSLVGGWNHAARIKLGEYWISYTGDDRNWPLFSNYAMPSTWADAWFGNATPPQNLAPIANAGEDQERTIATIQTFTLNGDGSYDPNNDQLIYNWAQVDGPAVVLDNSANANPTFEIGPAGATRVLVFQLQVNDGALWSDYDEVKITIHPPVAAAFAVNAREGWAPLQVCFTNISNGNGYEIGQLDWDFTNDGVVDSHAEQPCFTYARPGIYTAVLRVATPLGTVETRAQINALYNYPFDNPDTEGWSPYPLAGGTFINDPMGAFYIATTITSPASTTGIEDNGSQNLYGSWELKMDSPMQNCDDNYLYCARYELSTNQADHARVPMARLRWNDRSTRTFAGMFMNGANSPGTTPAFFNSWFFKSPAENCTGNEFLIYWDLADFDPNQTGNLYCHGVEVTRIVPSLTAAALIWDMNTADDFLKWGIFEAEAFLNPPTRGRGDGSIWLESPGPVGSKPMYYGGWSSPDATDGPRFETGHPYKAVFTMHSESAEAQKKLPMIRLRLFNRTYDWTAMRSVHVAGGTSDHMPAPAGTEYVLYMDAPPYLSGAPGAASDRMGIDFDIVDGLAEEEGRVYLDRVQVWRLPATY